MRILILSNFDMGLYKFRGELLEMLAASHKVYFCTPNGQYIEDIKRLGCRFICCNKMERRGTNPIKDIQLFLFYKRIIKHMKPDIVLTYTIKPNVYGGIVCSFEHIPFIANVTGLGTTIENGGALARLTTALYRIGLKDAACVFFQNADNQRMFLDQRIVQGRSRVIPGSGVNLKTHCYEPYPSDKDGIRFLFVGRIMKDKGVEELLKAISILHKEKKDITLDIVGWSDEDYTSELEKAKNEGAIRIHGVQKDVHSFYRNCHCVVLPSYHEGTSNVMLEASATGRPVVTTRVPGCQETFEEEITGFGCEAKSVESLLHAMRKFLMIQQHKREEMGKAAREKMEREFDRKIVLEAYNKEIEKMERGRK